jgi:hypothetical protein
LDGLPLGGEQQRRLSRLLTEVVPEAYEMVEDGLVTAADFRDFTFANVVRLFGRQNSRFFAGTRSPRRLKGCCTGRTGRPDRPT